MIFKNVSTGTTAPITNPILQDVWLGITGTGNLFIEFQGEDGLWRSFPQGSFTSPIAQMVSIKAGQFRFVVAGGPLIIEVSGESI